MAVCQNLVPLVNIKIAGKWMFIPLKMVLIGIDPYPYIHIDTLCEASYFRVVKRHLDHRGWWDMSLDTVGVKYNASRSRNHGIMG